MGENKQIYNRRIKMSILKRIKDNELQSKILQVKNLALFKIENNPELKKILDDIKTTDNALYSHSTAVADISCLIGILYNLRLDELLSLYLGCIFHDNGKTLLNQDILYKPTSFSSDERQLVEAHTTLGYKRIKKITADPIILDAIEKHHERINGLGYPNGLAEHEQSIFVKIIAVADVFDALISKRCYKEAITEEKAFEIISEDNGLDQIVVMMLKSLVCS